MAYWAGSRASRTPWSTSFFSQSHCLGRITLRGVFRPRLFCALERPLAMLDPPGKNGGMNHVPERWSESVQLPDMWLDPDQDPRDAAEPDPAGECETYARYLRDYRLTLELKCEGLAPEQLARRSVPPSTMSLLGLLRHLGEVERDWRNWISDGERIAPIYGGHGADFDGVRPEPECLAQALQILHEEQHATDRALANFADLGQRVGREEVIVRELQVHRIEEYARHCGHADLLRECIDGRVGQ